MHTQKLIWPLCKFERENDLSRKYRVNLKCASIIKNTEHILYTMNYKYVFKILDM